MTTTVRTAKGSTPAPAVSRQALERRLRAVVERISTLQRQLASWPDDPHTAVALMTARSQAAVWTTALSRSASTPSRDLRTLLAAAVYEDPSDPRVVQIGDTVTIGHVRRGGRERFTIVGGQEARFDESWISAGSPLGSAPDRAPPRRPSRCANAGRDRAIPRGRDRARTGARLATVLR